MHGYVAICRTRMRDSSAHFAEDTLEKQSECRQGCGDDSNVKLVKVPD